MGTRPQQQQLHAKVTKDGKYAFFNSLRSPYFCPYYFYLNGGERVFALDPNQMAKEWFKNIYMFARNKNNLSSRVVYSMVIEPSWRHE